MGRHSGVPIDTDRSTRGQGLAYGLAALLTFTGIAHFLAADFFRPLIPEQLGSADPWVYGSGLAELACAAAVAVPRTRRIGGYAAAALFLAVFPGNVQMALDAGDRSAAYQALDLRPAPAPDPPGDLGHRCRPPRPPLTPAEGDETYATRRASRTKRHPQRGSAWVRGAVPAGEEEALVLAERRRESTVRVRGTALPWTMRPAGSTDDVRRRRHAQLVDEVRRQQSGEQRRSALAEQVQEASRAKLGQRIAKVEVVRAGGQQLDALHPFGLLQQGSSSLQRVPRRGR